MKVLAIGNSFSEDAMRYQHGIAESNGCKLTVVNLMIGGCSLERHRQNMQSGEAAYTLEKNGESTGRKISLADALSLESWDVITLQQASHFSFRAETYHPFLEELYSFIKEKCPKATVLMHQTWAYEDGSEALLSRSPYASFEAMLDDVLRTYRDTAKGIGVAYIPSGELMGKLYDLGVSPLHRDGFHASLGIGRYAIGLLWYRALTGNSVLGNSFRAFDEPIDEETVTLIQKTVEDFSPLKIPVDL